MSGWHRTSRHERGYDSLWVKLREHILRRDKHLCQPCLRTGRITSANQVDHITPKAKGGTDDPSNLQAICSPCHDEKTAKDEGRSYRPRRKIGADGWPVG